MWFWNRHDDLRTLERRIDDLESAFRRLQAEWVDVYERFKRIAGRIDKRAERERDQEDAPEVNNKLPTVAQLKANGRFPFGR
jgi:hypothetical protein